VYSEGAVVGKDHPTVSASVPISAAQYLRMSTDRQEYSVENQAQAIAEYADSHGMRVVSTYSDPATSGVVFRKRKGLQKLIQDVIQGQALYKAILVYDVSRWGRFQDTDESAYYEFLCKSAGVPVHYCAEPFSNDDSFPNLIMKALKRAMAGEYSRELGVKILAGHRRGAALGFRQGGKPGYGLRRLLLAADGSPKQLLADGERKSITTDRIILVRGPAKEVRCVQDIYRMFIKKRMNFTDIARELNRRGTKYLDGSEWKLRGIRTILTSEKYCGANVFGRYSERLYTNPIRKPKSEWTVACGVFEALIEPGTQAEARRIIDSTDAKSPRNKSDDDLLNALRAILTKEGRITADLVERAANTPCANSYRVRFGALSNAYERIGYAGFWSGGWLAKRRSIPRLRDGLMRAVVDLDPKRVSIESRGGRHRACLLTHDGRRISVLASPLSRSHGYGYWLVQPPLEECQFITLVARVNEKGDAFKDLFVTAPIGKARGLRLRDKHPWWETGVPLVDLKRFFDAVQEVSLRCDG
jgi:DNA invertase Pin-like site-specific DNA recombinase